MPDTVKIEIPKAFYDVLVQKASVLWPEDEQMEHYYDVVTTHTPDDSYSIGVEQGEAAVAAEILSHFFKDNQNA